MTEVWIDSNKVGLLIMTEDEHNIIETKLLKLAVEGMKITFVIVTLLRLLELNGARIN